MLTLARQLCRGLGKTIQSIALMHTLLKQSPYFGERSTIQRVLIACPVTLVNVSCQSEAREREPVKLISVRLHHRIDSELGQGDHEMARQGSARRFCGEWQERHQEFCEEQELSRSDHWLREGESGLVWYHLLNGCCLRQC